MWKRIERIKKMEALTGQVPAAFVSQAVLADEKSYNGNGEVENG